MAMFRAVVLSPSAESTSAEGPMNVMSASAQARANRIHVALDRQGHDPGDVEIGPDRLARAADQIGLVGLEAVQREAVLVAVDGHGADSQLVGAAEYADGNLAAVGHQQAAYLL